MSLFKSVALQVPAIRRLREGRDLLIGERDKLVDERVQLLGERDKLSDERGKLLSEVGTLREALADAEARLLLGVETASTLAQAVLDLEGLRAAHLVLEVNTATMRLAGAENRLFITDYPYFPASRAIETTTGGRQIEAAFLRQKAAIADTVSAIARHSTALARIPRNATGRISAFWDNPWFPPFDGAALYGLIANNRPGRYIEVGSGISTRFARQAITDLTLDTQIISIDPHPHNAVEGLCDETITRRMEDMPSEFWAGLAADDMVFIDNSHRSFPGSDVTVFFTEVMPALPAGVVFGIHDIFLPSDYPQAWTERFYSEQYLLMMYLLGGARQDEILLPVCWATEQADLHGLLSELWEQPRIFDGIRTHGGAFWARRGPVCAM
jgi:predicted O-methyltransferase YrrM